VASGSPLRNVDTNRSNRSSPVKSRPVLRSTTNSDASRASSIPGNPLDDIPEEKFSLLFPTASAPEPSNPELSIDEITSTKLSLDDHAILSDLPMEKNRKQGRSHRVLMKKSLGSMLGDNDGPFKKMTKRIKRIPSELFTRKDRRAREVSTRTATPIPVTSTPEPSLPQLDLTTELFIPDTCTPSKSASPVKGTPPTLVSGVGTIPISACANALPSRWTTIACQNSRSHVGKRMLRYDCEEQNKLDSPNSALRYPPVSARIFMKLETGTVFCCRLHELGLMKFVFPLVFASSSD
jgi:hypothetical protein